jgi:hypothetical protein
MGVQTKTPLSHPGSGVFIATGQKLYTSVTEMAS